MSLPTSRIARKRDNVNPLPRRKSRAHKNDSSAMWNKIVELEPVISSAARRMAAVYDEDAGELAGRMRMALIEKARKLPNLLTQANGYIFRTLVNETHSYYRKLFGSHLQYHVSSLDDIDEYLPGDGDDLDTSERAEAVRQALALLDDDCRALAQAIMASGEDLERYAHSGVNVNALARKLGTPKSTVYNEMARLRVQLAVAIA